MNSETYERMEKVLHHIAAHRREPLSNDDLAAVANLSPFHFLRTFRTYVGTTPDRFVRFLQKEDLRTRLAGRAPTSVTYELGLSSPSRLNDLTVTFEAVTPGEWGSGGQGLKIRWGEGTTLFGRAAVFWTERGIVRLSFSGAQAPELVCAEVKRDFAQAELTREDIEAQNLLGRVFSPAENAEKVPLHLLVKGTNFQIKVWEALIRVPFGSVVSYQALAQTAGVPKASRAVGSAVGANSIAYLIPCHRVIRKDGLLGDYRWGAERKEVLLGWEASQV